MSAPATNALLKAYEAYSPPTSSRSERLFGMTLWITLSLCASLGCFLHTIKPLSAPIGKSIDGIKASFVIGGERPTPVAPVVRKQPAIKPAAPAPVDLTRKPPLSLPPDAAPAEAAPVNAPPAPRRVFGLRRVYSVGLGSGGLASDAIVAKIGNTIHKEYDTATATEDDIKGVVVSTATVTAAPRFRKIVKPVYTKEMIDRRIEGTVKVRVLVDIDGKVKKAACVNDIGSDSATQAVEATMMMEFDPAMRGNDPVAVWIIIPIKFVLLG